MHSMDWDDAMQECAVMFTQCVNKYWDQPYGDRRVDTPQWLMALFQTTVIRQWIRYAKRDYNNRALDASLRSGLPEEGSTEWLEASELAQHVASLPGELLAVFRLLAHAPGDLMQVLLQGTPVLVNRRLLRFSGIARTADRDVLGEIHAVLHGGSD